MNAMKNLLNHACELYKSKKILRSAQNDNKSRIDLVLLFY